MLDTVMDWVKFRLHNGLGQIQTPYWTGTLLATVLDWFNVKYCTGTGSMLDTVTDWVNDDTVLD